MDISSLYNNSSINSDLQRGDNGLSGLGGGNDPLSRLNDRVSSALKQDDQTINSVDSQAVKKMISDLFSMPQAGLNHNTVV